MSRAFYSIKGLTYFDSRRAYHGFTLFSPLEGDGTYLIDMMGRVVKSWSFGYRPGMYGELLPNGHVLFAGKIEAGPVYDIPGAGGILLEVDWDGNSIWEYKDPYLHHGFYRMRNGNTLVIKFFEIPQSIASGLAGGDEGTERNGIMWGDAVQEIDRNGKIVWEWIAHEHITNDDVIRCPLCPRDTWLHTNACLELENGNILVSFMKANTLMVIDKKSGEIIWKWGEGEIAHQHSPSQMNNGNILVFDNSLHQNGVSVGISRVLEIDPEVAKNQKIEGISEDVAAERRRLFRLDASGRAEFPETGMVWGYEGGERTERLFFSSTMSSCQRLPNQNTLICEGTTGRIFEITYRGETVWEYVNELPYTTIQPNKAKSKMVYSAFRYGYEYSGLKREQHPIEESRQCAQGTPRKERSEEEAVRSRLEGLGY